MTIQQTIKPQIESLGAMSIRRLLPSPQRQMVGPFIFMDQGGPLKLSGDQAGGVPEHPHAGLSTFTYLISGSAFHRDSAGNMQTVKSGDIALMNAGSGITHEELPDPEDKSTEREIYFLQMWLALPDEMEEMEPSLEHFTAKSLPLIMRENATIKLLMGEGWGVTAPTTCFVETLFAELKLEAGSSLAIENNCEERAIMLLEGDGVLDGENIQLHDLCLMDAADQPILISKTGCRAIVIGGEKFPSPRHIAGSFVGSSPQKITNWMRNYRIGRFPKIKR
jgi:redox-sensitive bicupin YhaK (pirin superfamily)